MTPRRVSSVLTSELWTAIRFVLTEESKEKVELKGIVYKECGVMNAYHRVSRREWMGRNSGIKNEHIDRLMVRLLGWMDGWLALPDDASLGKRGVENMSMMTMLSSTTTRAKNASALTLTELECVLCCLTQTATLLLPTMLRCYQPTEPTTGWTDGNTLEWITLLADWLACCCFETGLISERSFFQHTILFTVKVLMAFVVLERIEVTRVEACVKLRRRGLSGGELCA